MLEVPKTKVKPEVKLEPKTKEHAPALFTLTMATTNRFDFSIVDSKGKKLYSNLMSLHIE
jgi:hypothetical protein